jgi:hypothetical protein
MSSSIKYYGRLYYLRWLYKYLGANEIGIKFVNRICVQFKFLKLMALLKLWTEIFQNLVLDKFVSRYKHAVYAIVIPLLKKDYFQASNIQGFLATRLQG